MIYKLSMLAIITGFILYLGTFAQGELNQIDQSEITNAQNNLAIDDTSLPLVDIDSSHQPALDNPHYSKCAGACEKIWQKWPNVTNKELCQQECLMKVIDSELTQSFQEDKKEGKKKDKKKRD